MSRFVRSEAVAMRWGRALSGMGVAYASQGRGLTRWAWPVRFGRVV